jgi:SAM-dependent methyltransferase
MLTESALAMAEAMEKIYVEDVYNEIADDFDRTRYFPWPSVVNFINSLEKDSSVLDAGCGNGKNMQIRNDLKYIGCDNSEKLLNICKNKGLDTVYSNIKNLPFLNATFDNVICIAVLHHINLEEDRVDTVNELLRVLKPGGKLLFQVWAKEQTLTKRFIQIKSNSNDYFVTWKKNGKNGQDTKILKRYYHLFPELEINELLAQLYNIKVIAKTFEQNNWCVTLLKYS